MTEGRYHELLGQVLDSGLTEAGAEELRRALEADPGRLRDFREHLMLWDLWAQEQEPSRGAEAFSRAFQDRFRTECEHAHAVEPRPGRDPKLVAGDRRRMRRRAILACAAGAALALTVGLLLNRLRQDPGAVNRAAAEGQLSSIRPVSLRGEAICTKCILHQSPRCQMAIRVQESGKESVLLVNSDGATADDLGHAYCVAPVPVLAQGSVRSAEGQRYLAATRIDVQR